MTRAFSSLANLNPETCALIGPDISHSRKPMVVLLYIGMGQLAETACQPPTSLAFNKLPGSGHVREIKQNYQVQTSSLLAL